ncbi:glycoside hydrolase family 13 protein [Fervidibacillus albus]|uniref:oligo-1,6-glucosidase n=1 Tax=Fervidibacillus albus TaxID=2980026 RepID=A0A9E8LSW0_9BACI|nr:alpha-glucosidase [Fervidibacillus albus]WAA08917.1 alpha-glucosidase [Fervidibacillus albus]
MKKTNRDWWKKSVVYQIYPKSFYDSNGDGVGDILGIVEKLDYLKKLGIDVIWVSPIYDSPQVDNGYDIRNYKAIFHQYGTMDDFDLLLKEVHKRDMKLVMDLVVNHTSDEHIWFIESRKNKNSPYRDYYIWRDGKGDGMPPNNWGSIFGGSAWKYDEKTEQYYLHLFAVKQPDLNWENEELRKDIYKMMRFWLDKGIDGFRMDVINFISKNQQFPDGEIREGQAFGDGGPYFVNGPRIHEYLQEMNREVLSKYDIMTVGEMPGASTEDAKKYTNPQNNELNMIFTFEHMNLDCKNGDKWDLKPLDLVELKKNFEKWQTSLHGIGWNSLYWNNHDQPRIVSRFGDDETYREKSAKMLAVCLHMMQGTPYIYQGEEIGMTNVRFEKLEDYRDIELFNMYKEKQQLGWSHKKIMNAIYAKGRDNARTPMQWDDGENAGFTKGTPWINVNPRYKEINVKAALEHKESIFYFYQRLIQLRKEKDVITSGKFELLLRDNPKIFAYKRIGEKETFIVLCNFSNEHITIEDLELVSEIKNAPVVISNEKTNNNRKELTPYEAVVYSLMSKN